MGGDPRERLAYRPGESMRTVARAEPGRALMLSELGLFSNAVPSLIGTSAGIAPF